MNKLLKIQVGLRLFMIGLFICVGQFAMAAITLVAPIAVPWSASLGITPEEQKKLDEQNSLLEKVREAAKKEIEISVKAINEDGEKKMKEIVEEKIKAFKDLPIDKLKAVVEDMQKVNEAVADLKAKQASGQKEQKEDLFKKSLQAGFADMQKAVLGGGAYKFDFKPEESKIAASSFGDRVIFGFREAGIDFAQLPELFILDLIQVMSGGPGSNPLSWIERNIVANGGAGALLVETQAPAGVLEQGNKLNMGFAWVENKVSAETIAAMLPITKQAIQNYTMLEQEGRFELMRRLAAVLQTQIIRGSGVSPELKGITEYAKAFDAGTFAGTIQQANEYDVLVAAATQILQQNYVPTVGLISHIVKGRMNLAKGANGQYVLPPFSTVGGLNVYGLKIISSNDINAEEFIVFDPTKSLFNWVEGITIEVGMINDDFKKNIYRLRAELTGMHRIKNHEAFAFVQGDFALAKEDMQSA